MTLNQVALTYLVASVFFILALKGLSSPVAARRGNLFGIVGMAMAVLTTLAITRGVPFIVLAIAAGGTVGAIVARRVHMTQMPELVAAMHSLVGLAAVLIAIAAINNPAAFNIPVPLPRGNRMELFIGTFVGAITFSGSVIAFGKLSGKITSAPLVFKGQHWLNLVLAIIMIGFGVAFYLAAPDSQWPPYIVMTAIAFLLGFLIIIPIG
ncbi:MAG TPA: NAD(P)(+) transhydrogenase (Re/Si-specific) subunit beta, partial [Burkholderiales bacterium]|nr:NAD(P)(+) transhydrogenase (Re/Si-specific) subunit beta [Burkholderiales bacterium]